MTNVRWQFSVRGRVQGVGYRRFVQRAALANGLVGFVRNEADGRVRGEVEGPLPQLLRWQQDLQRGPLLARVEEVAVLTIEAVASRDADFRILP